MNTILAGNICPTVRETEENVAFTLMDLRSSFAERPSRVLEPLLLSTGVPVLAGEPDGGKSMFAPSRAVLVTLSRTLSTSLCTLETTERSENMSVIISGRSCYSSDVDRIP
jgi:hypothetical protein